MILGAHLSIAQGFEKAGKIAVDIGANTFQFFTRNPRGGTAKKLSLKDIEALQLIMDGHNFGPLLAHAPYTLNLASNKSHVREFGMEMLRNDLDRMEKLPTRLYNLHPGSHLKDGPVVGIERVCQALNQVMTGEETSTILLETMAGKGSELGASFEELRDIIEGLDYPDHFGVCLDTCHVFDAGYDIKDHFDEVMLIFDKIVGIERIKAIHLNDSMYGLGSHKDRHAGFGEGEIGAPALMNILTYEPFAGLPFFLETPYDDEGHKREISLIKEWLNYEKN